MGEAKKTEQKNPSRTKNDGKTEMKNWAWTNRDLAQQLYGDDHIYAIAALRLLPSLLLLFTDADWKKKCNRIITWARPRRSDVCACVSVFVCVHSN